MLDRSASSDELNSEILRWDYTNANHNEDVTNRVDRRLRQAAGLSSLLYAEGLDSFLSLNDIIKDDVLWLLHDTICDAMEARREEQNRGRT